jgi:hypothetical protein
MHQQEIEAKFEAQKIFLAAKLKTLYPALMFAMLLMLTAVHMKQLTPH